MKALEAQAESKGVSRFTLMENAGREVARVLEEKTKLKDKRILIVCYHGNNGGDGFVAARYLAEKAEVDLLFIGEESKLKKEAEDNLKKIEENDMIQFTSLDFVNFNDYDIIIDALLGTGTKGELKYPINTVVDFINESEAFKLSIDIPTGLNPDTGEIKDKAIDADLIVTFHDLKTGLEKLKDKTIVVGIGIPD